MSKLLKATMLSICLFTGLCKANLTEVSLHLPFGLNWEQTKKDISTTDVRLSRCYTVKSLDICSALNSDNLLFLSSSIKLYFSRHSGKLVYLKIISKSTTNDLDGQQGRDIYQHLKEWSGIKTDVGRTYEFVTKTYLNRKKGFYECLNYLSCANYSSYKQDSHGNLGMVKLMSDSLTGGKIIINYQSKDFN